MEPELAELVNAVRLLHNRLVAIAEELHDDSGISVPQRAVLEFVTREGPSAVPDIARSRKVTRQHIQTIANTLLTAGLVAAMPNPAHRRSPLLELTPKGADAITATFDRERAHAEQHLGDLDRDDVIAAARLLNEIAERL